MIDPWGEFRIWRLVVRWLPAWGPFGSEWLVGWVRRDG
jgi:hypothetical protein